VKKVRVIFSPEAEEVYKYLNENATDSKTENMILKAVHKKIGFIKANSHYGDPIAKKLIPEEYKIKYGVSNLFRVELPQFWRMLYTLTNGDSEIEIIAFVLDIIDHKEYDKKFGYKSN
jgi:mRNA-degrading endonuclease RelE of RelBE toxin-antitoxin system